MSKKDNKEVEDMSDNSATGPVVMSDETTKEEVKPKETAKDKPAGSPTVSNKKSPYDTKNVQDDADVSSTTVLIGSYVDSMKKAKSPEEYVAAQYMFLKLIKDVCKSRSQSLFNKRWSIILNKAHEEENTVFNLRVAFKGGECWTGSQTDYSLLRHLTWLIIKTANPETRFRNAKEVNLTAATMGLSAEQKTNLSNYYKR